MFPQLCDIQQVRRYLRVGRGGTGEKGREGRTTYSDDDAKNYMEEELNVDEDAQKEVKVNRYLLMGDYVDRG